MPVPAFPATSVADAAAALVKYRSNATVLADPRNGKLDKPTALSPRMKGCI